MRTFAGVLVWGLFCLLLCSCGSDKPKAESGGVTLPASSGSTPSSKTAANAGQVDVCSFFTEADAESIMGAPMRRSKITNPQRNCIYEEVKARPNTIGPGTVSLTLNQRKSIDDENRGWAEIKEVRHLQQGQKNVHALDGIGDEAWFTGNTEKGKVGVAAVTCPEREIGLHAGFHGARICGISSRDEIFCPKAGEPAGISPVRFN